MKKKTNIIFRTRMNIFLPCDLSNNLYRIEIFEEYEYHL